MTKFPRIVTFYIYLTPKDLYNRPRPSHPPSPTPAALVRIFQAFLSFFSILKKTENTKHRMYAFSI